MFQKINKRAGGGGRAAIPDSRLTKSTKLGESFGYFSNIKGVLSVMTY